MAHYQQLFNHSLEAMESGDYSSACAGWSQALECLEGDDEETCWERSVVMLNQAVCYLSLQQLPQAEAICAELLEGPQALHPAEDLGQQALGVLFDVSMARGDYGRARQASERAVQALEEQEGPSCSPDVFSATARRRAELAREIGRPDDAEEALTLALHWLKALRTEPETPAEEAMELALCEAGLLQSRAHNRYEGQALQLALFDLEDAVKLLAETVGEEAPQTLQARELWAQLAQDHQKPD